MDTVGRDRNHSNEGRTRRRATGMTSESQCPTCGCTMRPGLKEWQTHLAQEINRLNRLSPSRRHSGVSIAAGSTDDEILNDLETPQDNQSCIGTDVYQRVRMNRLRRLRRRARGDEEAEGACPRCSARMSMARLHEHALRCLTRASSQPSSDSEVDIDVEMVEDEASMAMYGPPQYDSSMILPEDSIELRASSTRRAGSNGYVSPGVPASYEPGVVPSTSAATVTLIRDDGEDSRQDGSLSSDGSGGPLTQPDLVDILQHGVAEKPMTLARRLLLSRQSGKGLRQLLVFRQTHTLTLDQNGSEDSEDSDSNLAGPCAHDYPSSSGDLATLTSSLTNMSSPSDMCKWSNSGSTSVPADSAASSDLGNLVNAINSGIKSMSSNSGNLLIGGESGSVSVSSNAGASSNLGNLLIGGDSDSVSLSSNAGASSNLTSAGDSGNVSVSIDLGVSSNLGNSAAAVPADADGGYSSGFSLDTAPYGVERGLLGNEPGPSGLVGSQCKDCVGRAAPGDTCSEGEKSAAAEGCAASSGERATAAAAVAAAADAVAVAGKKEERARPRAGDVPPMRSHEDQSQIVASLRNEIKELMRQKDNAIDTRCLICLDSYQSPCVSIMCWHVYCESCWLQSLRSKRLCPQCCAITTAEHLRRIYL